MRSFLAAGQAGGWLEGNLRQDRLDRAHRGGWGLLMFGHHLDRETGRRAEQGQRVVLGSCCLSSSSSLHPDALCSKKVEVKKQEKAFVALLASKPPCARRALLPVLGP